MENLEVSRLPSAELWAGKRVLLTGHTGFKGAWLSAWLLGLGTTVAGFSLPPETEPSLYQLLALDDRVQSTYGDICDADLLFDLVAKFQPELIIHMAAQALVRRSYEQPLETYRVNVLGTTTLLDTVRRCPGVRAVLVVTTDKVYENVNWCWGYRENDRHGGHDPYSNSKACCELVVDAYRRSFLAERKQFLASARAGNVIGGGDYAADRLVPDGIRAFAAGEPLVLRMPRATRPWQHVLEPLCGYLLISEGLLAGKPDYCQAFNLGPTSEHPVEDAARLLARGWGGQARVEIAPDAPKHHEAQTLHLDSNKAQRVIGWGPRLEFEKAISMTVDFYRGLHDQKAAWSLLENDLNSYRSLGAREYA